ncbi:MAG: TonB-dependent receptor domain-containing protein [Gammaproteobacteria bacterium]
MGESSDEVPLRFLSVYGGYSESFVPVGGTNPDGAGFGPETGRGYEAGVKLDTLGGRILGTLAFYRIAKENVPNPIWIRTAQVKGSGYRPEKKRVKASSSTLGETRYRTGR